MAVFSQGFPEAEGMGQGGSSGVPTLPLCGVGQCQPH